MKPIVLVLALLAVLLAGCTPQGPPPTPTATPLPSPTPTREGEVAIPFETIAIGGLRGDIPPSVGERGFITDFGPQSVDEMNALIDKGPFLFLATSPSDLDSFANWLQPKVLATIKMLDFEQYVVVAFFLGLRAPGGGYIERIAIAGQTNTITVYAVERQFLAGPDVLDFPGHIVRVHRQDVPFPLGPDTQVVLVTRTELIGTDTGQQ